MKLFSHILPGTRRRGRNAPMVVGLLFIVYLFAAEVMTAVAAAIDANGHWPHLWKAVLPEAAVMFTIAGLVFSVHTGIYLLSVLTGLRARAGGWTGSETEYNPSTGNMMMGDSGLDAEGEILGG